MARYRSRPHLGRKACQLGLAHLARPAGQFPICANRSVSSQTNESAFRRAIAGLLGDEGLGRFLVGGTAWAGAGLAAAVVLAFGVNAVAARLLSEAHLGAFLLMVSITQAVSVWAEVGQPGLIAREIAGRLGADPKAAAQYVSRVLVLVAVATAVIAAVAAVAGRTLADIFFGDPAITAVFGLLGLLVLGRAGERTFGDIFRGQYDIRLATVFGTVWGQAAAAAALGALLLFQGNVSGQTAVLTYGAAVATVVPAALLVLHGRMPRVGLPRSGYGENLREGWPLIGYRSLAMVLEQAPLWIVAAVAGATGAAPFGLALRVVTAVAIPLTVVNQVVPPVVARLYSTGELAKLERAVRATATFAASGAVVLVAVFVAFGEPIIEIAFGAQYVAEATPLLIILSIGQLGAVWAGSCAIVLIQIGHQRTLMAITGVTMIIELAAATVAAHTFGTVGVALVAAGGMIAKNIAIVVAVHRRTGIRTDVSVPTLVKEVRLRLRRYDRDESTKED